jgi:hypothetical protein
MNAPRVIEGWRSRLEREEREAERRRRLLLKRQRSSGPRGPGIVITPKEKPKHGLGKA